MNLSRLTAARVCTAVFTSALFALLLSTASTHSYARGPEAKPVPGTGTNGGGDGTPIEEPEATPDDGKDGGGPPPRPNQGDDTTPSEGTGWILEQVLRALNLWILR